MTQNNQIKFLPWYENADFWYDSQGIPDLHCPEKYYALRPYSKHLSC